jgi:hypothetical protein
MQHMTRTPTPAPTPLSWAPLALVLGGGLTALALGAKLLGLTLLTDHAILHTAVGGLGVALFTLGVVVDQTVGPRHLLAGLTRRLWPLPTGLKFLSVVAQLGLLVLISQRFTLESAAWYRQVLPLALYGFILHYLLPRPYRLPFFVLLSLAGLVGVLGLEKAAWVVGLGGGLIALCHLPVPFAVRLGLVGLAGALLITLRAGWLASPWPSAIWPIFGSLFMFRLIVYLYDLKHSKAPVEWWRTLAYFFLLPNVAFPLFPVVDYTTFGRTYYDDDEYRIYQRGVQWMFRGVWHLLLYRYVNYYWVLGPEDVTTVSSLVQYLVANFFLILRVSGQFHLIIGLLHLFGFNLPRVMQHFMLADGFTDLWRRANIYWKDFMQKVFFYPSYFQLRRWGTTTALWVALLLVFVATWLLHAAQWFWLRGTFLLSGPDISFWALLGLLVIVNSLYEEKYGRKRTLRQHTWTVGELVARTVRTLGTFSVLCVLWSLWTSASFAEWGALWAGLRVTEADVGQVVLLVIGAAVVVAGALLVLERPVPQGLALGARAGTSITPLPSFVRQAAMTGVLLLLVYVIGHPAVYFQLRGPAREIVRDLRTDRLSKPDADLLVRGYYENLAGMNRLNTQLWELYMQQPDDWVPLRETKAIQRTGDALRNELRPSVALIFKEAPFHTNRWGMRDKDYEKLPPPQTYRIALLGGSHTMGPGVGDDETFEALLEDRLNREHTGDPYARYEILNFAVDGYTDTQRLMVLERKVFAFQPQAVFYVGHPRDVEITPSDMGIRLRRKVAIPYEALQDIVHTAGVTEDMSPDEAKKRLKPFGRDMLAWIYRQVVDACRQRGIVPVWICLPGVAGADESQQAVGTVRLAQEAGFVVINLADVYKHAKKDHVHLALWDWHPNARGHRLIADRLYEALRALGPTLPLGLATPAEAPTGHQPVSAR